MSPKGADKNMLPIKSQVILVTGSTDGVGRITAQKLAGTGASVLVHGRTGIYFDEKREAHAHPQAYDRDAREKLRRLSEKLVGMG